MAWSGLEMAKETSAGSLAEAPDRVLILKHQGDAGTTVEGEWKLHGSLMEGIMKKTRGKDHHTYMEDDWKQGPASTDHITGGVGWVAVTNDQTETPTFPLLMSDIGQNARCLGYVTERLASLFYCYQRVGNNSYISSRWGCGLYSSWRREHGEKLTTGFTAQTTAQTIVLQSSVIPPCVTSRVLNGGCVPSLASRML